MVADALELPVGEPREFSARSPWKGDRNKRPISLRAGHATTFALEPFEVLVLDITNTRKQESKKTRKHEGKKERKEGTR
jgi:hypothetical protein